MYNDKLRWNVVINERQRISKICTRNILVLSRFFFFSLQMFGPDNTFQCGKEANKKYEKIHGKYDEHWGKMIDWIGNRITWYDFHTSIHTQTKTQTHARTRSNKQANKHKRSLAQFCDVLIVLFTWLVLHSANRLLSIYRSNALSATKRMEKYFLRTCYTTTTPFANKRLNSRK